jgi:hypothetical protein
VIQPIVLPQPAQAAPAEPPKKKSSGCAILVLLLIVFIVVASCLPRSDTDTSPSQPTASVPGETEEQQRARLLTEATDSARAIEARRDSAQLLASRFPTTDEGKSGAKLAGELQEQIRKANLGKQWNYWKDTDSMTSKSVLGAAVLSSNTQSFSSPYDGAQHAKLTIRRHPRHGADVILSIERGQLMCQSYRECQVLVRFGENEPRRYSALGPEDNSSVSLFILNVSDFQKRMQGVDKVRIQANVYRQGAPTWEFDVSGFDPDRLKQ